MGISALDRRNRLVEAHLSLVPPIARRAAAFLPASFELEDLISAGNLGLLTAAARYRPRRHGSAPFPAFARPRIHGAIIDSVRRRPFRDAKLALALVELPELATAAGIEESIDDARRASALSEAVAELAEPWRAVISRHYDGGEHLGRIGRSYSVGKSRASQIHLQALGALRGRLQRFVLSS